MLNVNLKEAKTRIFFSKNVNLKEANKIVHTLLLSY